MRAARRPGARVDVMADVAGDMDWLTRFSPREWMNASMAELGRAEAAYRRRDARGGLSGCRRAAGMAVNAILRAMPEKAYGRTYVEHLEGLSADASVPDAVRAACRLLLDAPPPGGSLIVLRARNTPFFEAARDVMAHAYAMVLLHAPHGQESESA